MKLQKQYSPGEGSSLTDWGEEILPGVDEGAGAGVEVRSADSLLVRSVVKTGGVLVFLVKASA